MESNGITLAIGELVFVENEVRKALIMELLDAEEAAARVTIRRMARIRELLCDYNPGDGSSVEIKRYEDGEQPYLMPDGWKVFYGS